MILSESEVHTIREMNKQGFKPGNIDAENLLDTIADLQRQLRERDQKIDILIRQIEDEERDRRAWLNQRLAANRAKVGEGK